MSTNQALISQLTGTDCLIYLAMDPVDTFKSVAMYRNLQGDNGVLNAAQLGALNLTFADLPVIVKASVLADAIQEGDPRMRKLSDFTFSIENSSTVAGAGDETCEYDQEKVFAEVDARIAAAVSSVYKPKGSVESVADLPVEGNNIGDVYSVRNENGAEYAWVERDGEQVWDLIGTITDLSDYYKKTDVDGIVASVSDIIAALENATETKLTAEEAARIQAVNAVDDKISFAELINRVWIYGENVFDLNLMVKPGMYYCSSDASVVGTAMTNMPDGTAEGCLLVLKNSQIFWEGGSNKGRTYYRYQTGAGPNVSEYTEAWTAGAMLSDVKELKEYFIELNKLQAGINETHSESIRVVTEAHYDLEEKVAHLDYTAFEVYATSELIPAGTIDPDTGIAYAVDVPAGMIHNFKLRSDTVQGNQDVVIYWGDGESSSLQNGEFDSLNDSEFNENGEIEYIVSHEYAAPGKYIVKIIGKKYWGIQSFNSKDRPSILSRVFSDDLPIASNVINLSQFARNTPKLQRVLIPTGMDFFANINNATGIFQQDINLVSVTNLATKFQHTRYVQHLFNGCSNLVTCDFKLPSNCQKGDAYRQVFNGCPKLAADISALLPERGFAGLSVNILECFKNCYSLTGSVPASKLWEDSRIEWINTDRAFIGCSDAIRAQVPTSWGGTNTEIEAKIQSGYWKKVNQYQLDELSAEVSLLKSEFGLPKVEIISGGTVAEPKAVNFVGGKWYIATTPFIGTLPENPDEGTLIQVSITKGQENMSVVPAGSNTISEASNPCILGVFIDGTFVDGETHRFVYNEGNWILL